MCVCVCMYMNVYIHMQKWHRGYHSHTQPTQPLKGPETVAVTPFFNSIFLSVSLLPTFHNSLLSLFTILTYSQVHEGSTVTSLTAQPTAVMKVSSVL
jgi:hypothetical protein